MLLAPAAACFQLIACRAQEDQILKEQESRTKVLPKYMWLEVDGQKHSETWRRSGGSVRLPLQSACPVDLHHEFVMGASCCWGWQPGMLCWS